jgi:hypothetical protein
MEENIYYVYVIIDPRNDKIIYIGKGNKSRYLDHERIAKSENRPVINRKLNNKLKKILKLGLFPIYEFPYILLSEDDAYKLERHYTDEIGLSKLCNLKDGGTNGCKFSADSKLKMGVSQKKRWELLTKEEKEIWSKHLSEMNMGHIVTQETKDKLSTVLKGVKWIDRFGEEKTKEIIEKIKKKTVGQKRPKQSAALKGRPAWNKGKKTHSDEFKKKQRERFLTDNPGKNPTNETKKKISDSKRGKKIKLQHTDDFKKSVSIRMKKYWEEKRNEKAKSNCSKL